MADDSFESSLDERIAGRLDNHLTRRGMSDGGEVFTGRLASRALRAVGARAMTVNRSIIVDTTFNTNNPEDLGLYAHEQVHQQGSGGEAGHTMRDAEEIAARAAEAMVVHRSETEGGAEHGHSPGRSGSHNPGDGNSEGDNPGPTAALENAEQDHSSPDPARGYLALRDQGYQHQDIVDELVRAVMAEIQEGAQAGHDRHQDKKGYL
ncbi:MAG: DUF4157 domain-containing protein [Myxococcota bacterium]